MDFKKYFSKKNILITGGLGFIGSNLAHKLVELGANILIVDSLIPEYGGNLFNISDIKDKVQVNFSDIRDSNSLHYLVQNKDYIFNLAGQVSHIDSMENPFDDLEINCKSQLSILEVCRRYNTKVKIIFASTRQIYGRPTKIPVDENTLLNPIDVNGINKMAGEWYHILYNNVYGIKTVSLRLTNTYGPRMLMKNNRQGFTNWFIRQAIDNEQIQIFGDGKQLRDFNYIDDVVDAFLLVATNDETYGDIFNLGGDKSISLIDFVRTLLDICGSDSYKNVPFPKEQKKIDIGDYQGDYTKFNKLTGWRPKIDLKEGLKRTVEYYKKNKQYYW